MFSFLRKTHRVDKPDRVLGSRTISVSPWEFLGRSSPTAHLFRRRNLGHISLSFNPSQDSRPASRHTRLTWKAEGQPGVERPSLRLAADIADSIWRIFP